MVRGSYLARVWKKRPGWRSGNSCKEEFMMTDIYLGRLGDLYRTWYAWHDQLEPAQTIDHVLRTHLLRQPERIDVLDCACGVGDPCIGLAQRGLSVVASDGSPKQLAALRDNLAGKGLPVEVVAAPVEWHDLVQRFGDRRFDAVVCTGNSICHVSPQDAAAAIRDMAALLRPGGVLMIDVKQYTPRMRELRYDAGQGWVVRTDREEKRLMPDGREARFTTRIVYPEDFDDCGRYLIESEVAWGDGENLRDSHPVWAISTEVVLSLMRRGGLQLLEAGRGVDPAIYKYTLCIGCAP